MGRATLWVDCFPLKDKSAENARVSILSFAGGAVIGTMYTDGSRELEAAVRVIGCVHEVFTPYRPQTNGVTARAVKDVLEGTRMALTHAVLPP